ncbi:MAG: CapA family protein [Acidimicrobiia bacterium]|nr:CapA family protein [Acidimicrobiia bacterium]
MPSGSYDVRSPSAAVVRDLVDTPGPPAPPLSQHSHRPDDHGAGGTFLTMRRMPGRREESENRPSRARRLAGAALFGILAATMTAVGDGALATPPPPPEPYRAPSGPAPSADADPASMPSSAPAIHGPRSFTIAATGDLLIHSPIVRRARRGDGWDFTPMFDQVAPILQAADLAVCHVETPMSPDNERLSTFPLFSVPNQLADSIAYAGYDTCSLASNHSLDSGMRGVAGTIDALDRVGVAHTGMARSPEQGAALNLLDVKGATVAHLSYTYGLNTGELRPENTHLANIIDEETILVEAGRARAAGADFILLSLHWGTEFRRMPDRYQTEVGPRLLSSPDVDLIIGHHAHVVQPVARIGGEYIAYGLGNFLSNQSPQWGARKPGTQDGVILRLTVTQDPTTGRWSVTSISHTPTRVNRATFEIVNALNPSGSHNPVELARSAADTARALTALGTTVRALPGLTPDVAEWLSDLLDARYRTPVHRSGLRLG